MILPGQYPVHSGGRYQGTLVVLARSGTRYVAGPFGLPVPVAGSSGYLVRWLGSERQWEATEAELQRLLAPARVRA